MLKDLNSPEETTNSDPVTKEGKLIVVVGATGVGKSAHALELAQHYHTPIISADSRQMYRGMAIGTDAPSAEALAAVPHFFIQTLEPNQSMSAHQWAQEAETIIQREIAERGVAIVVGGSMLYIQALLKGQDPIPEPDPEIRIQLWKRFENDGVAPLREELLQVDPTYLTRIDPNNHKRIIRALEVYYTTGTPFTHFHHRTEALRAFPFDVHIHNITRPRTELFGRIEARVASMLERGLLEEVRSLLPYRSCNALNTIGYKEIFQYLDGKITLPQAEALIIRHTKVYARQQERFFQKLMEQREQNKPETEEG